MSTRIIALALALALVIALSLCACTKAPNKEYNDVPSKDSIGSTIDKNLNNDATNDEKNEDVESEKEEGVPTPKDDAVINNATEVIPGEHNLDDYKSVKIKSGGQYTFTGTLHNGMIYVNTVERVEIILKDASVSNKNGPCVYVHNAQGVEIELVGNNTIKSSGQYWDEEVDSAIYSDVKTTFKGDGKINIQATLRKGIKCESNLFFLGGHYEILSDDDCVNSKQGLTVENGKFILTSREEKGMKSGTTFTINEGDFEINSCGDALRAEELMIINNGIINIPSCDEGIESKGSIVISSGDITIHSADDSINAIEEIKITGGKLNLTADGNDAIDGNDKLIITGGYIYATATSRGEGAIDTAQDGLYVSGGTIIGIGYVNSARNLGDGNILIITPSDDEKVNKIEVKDENGNVVFSCDIGDYTIIKKPEALDKDEENQKPTVDVNSGPILQRPVIKPPYRWRIPGKFPGIIITPPHPPRLIIDIRKTVINQPSEDLKVVKRDSKSETIVKNQFDNIDVGAASFFITFPNLVNGTYDIYLNGEYNETITVKNESPNHFRPIFP